MGKSLITQLNMCNNTLTIGQSHFLLSNIALFINYYKYPIKSTLKSKNISDQ